MESTTYVMTIWQDSELLMTSQHPTRSSAVGTVAAHAGLTGIEISTLMRVGKLDHGSKRIVLTSAAVMHARITDVHGKVAA